MIERLLSATSPKRFDMRLRRLTGLEREKIENEYQDLLVLIADLRYLS